MAKQKKTKKAAAVEVPKALQAEETAAPDAELQAKGEAKAAEDGVVATLETAEPKVTKESMEEKIARIVGQAIGQALPMAAGVMAKTMADAQAKQAQDINAQAMSHRLTGEKCEGCKQFLPRGVEQGQHEHRKVVVFPTAQRHGKWFQGVRINGELYLSNNRSHAILVPADANIEYLLQQWEDNEDAMLHGREAQHNSGSIGQNGSNFKEANSAWR